MNPKKSLHALAFINLVAPFAQTQDNPTITCTYEQHQVYNVGEPRDVVQITHENVEDFDWNPDNPEDARTQNNVKGFCELSEEPTFPENKDPENYVLTSINLDTPGETDDTRDDENYEFAADDIETPRHMRAFVYEGK